MRTTLIATLTAASMAVACSSDPIEPPVAPTGDTTDQSAMGEPAPAPPPKNPDDPDDDPSKSQIRISDAIKKACGITDTEALFAFNSANVRDSDQKILQKLADCFSTGPLKGKKMRLVGHADPRGDEEYNMLLGNHRAGNVKRFLVQKSLPSAQVETVSRGEMDASGTDEASWAQDRRVDVMLAE